MADPALQGAGGGGLAGTWQPLLTGHACCTETLIKACLDILPAVMPESINWWLFYLVHTSSVTANSAKYVSLCIFSACMVLFADTAGLVIRL